MFASGQLQVGVPGAVVPGTVVSMQWMSIKGTFLRLICINRVCMPTETTFLHFMHSRAGAQEELPRREC